MIQGHPLEYFHDILRHHERLLASDNIHEFSLAIKAMASVNALESGVNLFEAIEATQKFVDDHRDDLTDREKELLALCLFFSTEVYIKELVAERYCKGIDEGEALNISFLNKIYELLKLHETIRIEGRV